MVASFCSTVAFILCSGSLHPIQKTVYIWTGNIFVTSIMPSEQGLFITTTLSVSQQVCSNGFIFDITKGSSRYSLLGERLFEAFIRHQKVNFLYKNYENSKCRAQIINILLISDGSI